MKRHHINYEDIGIYHQHNKLDLSKFEDLSFGDSIHMQDGRLVGIFTETLSSFESDENLYAEKNCLEFIKGDPNLFYYQSGGQNGVESKTGVYGTRKVVSTSGDVIEQGLIKAFDEPAWINFPENAKVVHANIESDFSY